MEIKINGQKADVTVEQEKNVGEIMAGLEDWLSNTGHRLSGLAIDGKAVDALSLEEAFAQDIEKINILDIYTSNISDLTVESMVNLIADIDEYERLDFNEKKIFIENWKNSPQALFAEEHISDIYNIFINTFFHGNFNSHSLRSIMEERLREVEQPINEIKNIKGLIEETCEKLVNLPLDIQTGKDASAAAAIQIFTSIAEKIFRIINQLEIQGYLHTFSKTYSDAASDKNENDISQMIVDFGSVVREILDAYERKDSVLIGDIAEYEIAPKLQGLYNELLLIQEKK